MLLCVYSKLLPEFLQGVPAGELVDGEQHQKRVPVANRAVSEQQEFLLPRRVIYFPPNMWRCHSMATRWKITWIFFKQWLQHVVGFISVPCLFLSFSHTLVLFATTSGYCCNAAIPCWRMAPCLWLLHFINWSTTVYLHSKLYRLLPICFKILYF